ncbi:hypothetical protein GIB67_017757 [Kingdonia uniflora]|uniref:Uncharacterized protein n=1 Tax=Kingdonia uniflora TaxID=39325 RepID=A0A7J7LQC4_9MAGN|nr:hypothetical protein GIB67_017757 [Kingdonia uniflora]
MRKRYFKGKCFLMWAWGSIVKPRKLTTLAIWKVIKRCESKSPKGSATTQSRYASWGQANVAEDLVNARLNPEEAYSENYTHYKIHPSGCSYVAYFASFRACIPFPTEESKRNSMEIRFSQTPSDVPLQINNKANSNKVSRDCSYDYFEITCIIGPAEPMIFLQLGDNHHGEGQLKNLTEQVARIWIFTTHYQEVALHGYPKSHPYQLLPLHAGASWNLFVSKAFTKDGCPPYLEEFARNIMKKCEGLPLVIVVWEVCYQQRI